MTTEKLKPMQKRGARIILVALICLGFVQPAQAATPSPPEPYKLLYVVFNQSEPKTVGIELRDQVRQADGTITALVSVRADNLIAYNLGFETTDPNSSYLSAIDFLPLYPGHTYEIGRVHLKPGDYFKVIATPFGLKDEARTKMTIVQLAILGIHLVGAKPPTNVVEGIKTIPDAFDEVFGPIGAVAGAFKAVIEIFETRDVSADSLVDIGDAIAEVPGGSDKIADLINLITKNKGVRVTGKLVEGVFNAINVLNIVGNVKRAVDAFGQMRNYPVYITATITPAPEIAQAMQRYRVLELNEPYPVDLAFKNQSSEVWGTDGKYALSVLLEGLPLQNIPLSSSIRPGQNASWSFQQRALAIPGIYHIGYQMSYEGSLIGLSILGEIVVVPENSGSLKGLIDGLVQEAQHNTQDRLDQIKEEMERRIMNAIQLEIQRRLSQICGGTGIYSLVGVTLFLNLRRSRRKLRKRENLERGGEK